MSTDTQSTQAEDQRTILLVPHTGRADNVESSEKAAQLLTDAGINVRVCADESYLQGWEHVPHGPEAAQGCDLVLVLGGDGTFLRGADMAYQEDVPVLGINLGHVGFLAEGEASSFDEVISRVITRDYRIEDRMTITVNVIDADGNTLGSNWALNEVSVENTNRSGVLDAILEVDARPVTAFGCDGIIISTPTGSTAYAFSAGGPVMWPELDAILVVPSNAHALFTKPLVVSPKSTVAVESASTTAEAVIAMDGFRTLAMPPGSRLEVVRSKQPVRWVRLDNRPFTDRLVTKLHLPVHGWRGPQR